MLDQKTFYAIKDKVKLTKTGAKLFPYGSKEPFHWLENLLLQSDVVRVKATR